MAIELESKHVPDKERKKGIAICLSGGGFRATLFHLGALRRLNELGALSHPGLCTISSVSGGSIAAAYLAQALQWPLTKPIQDWDSSVAKELRAFTQTNLRTFPILKRLLPWNWLKSSTAVEALASAYEQGLTRLKLSGLPEKPEFVLCATDMAFGVNWEFTKRRMGDYQVGYVDTPHDWPLARAVAASSCFPPVFNPLPIPKSTGEFRDGAAQREQPEKWQDALDDLRLTDGGNYDNMGIEPVWKDHKTVLVSDAGGLFDFSSDRNLIWRVLRYQAIQENQARAVRKRWLISNFSSNVLAGAYWGIGSARTSYDRDDKLGYSKELARQVIAEIRTDLDAFSEEEAAVLENHGYLLADMALRKHAPAIMLNPGAALRPPFEDWLPPNKSEQELGSSLSQSHKRKKLGRW